MPRQNITRRAARARKRGNRTRVNRWRIDLDGGRWAFVDFQVTPPLGSSMSKRDENVWCLRDETNVMDNSPGIEFRARKIAGRESLPQEKDRRTRSNE